MFENLSYEAFKEPRGFLKVLQWLFAICAFATTVNFTTKVSVDLDCTVGNSTSVQTISHIIEYTFQLDHEMAAQSVKACSNVTKPDLECRLVGDAKSDSQFFVTTGVLTFLYATGLGAVYLLADKLYTENPSATKIDFIVTLILAVFWLSGSAAWANGLSAVKTGSDPLNWVTTLSSEQVRICDTLKTGFKCAKIVEGVFGGLTISVLFGFINFILWAANLWFLYKETPWFDGIGKNSGISSPGTSGI